MPKRRPCFSKTVRYLPGRKGFNRFHIGRVAEDAGFADQDEFRVELRLGKFRQVVHGKLSSGLELLLNADSGRLIKRAWSKWKVPLVIKTL